MTEDIKLGSLFTWTLQSPKESGKIVDEFYAFIDDRLDQLEENAQISGTVIYISEGSAVIKVSEMTPSLFPFTLFYNEIQNSFFDFKQENVDPYQKYFCLDVASMVSQFFYYEVEGFLASAEFDSDGNFDYYEQPDENGSVDFDGEEDSFVPDQISILLPKEEIESYEDLGALCNSENNLDYDGDLIPRGDACSVKRAETWFNTRDCAILTAWRGENSRKTNDDNNRKLQRRLRELGYGVTKITGWFAEKDKEVARENSFLTVNLNEEDSFRSNIFELSELYEQDSFLYKKAGRDIPAVLVHTNDDTGKGTEELAGRLRIGNMEADIYSQIKAGRITFE